MQSGRPIIRRVGGSRLPCPPARLPAAYGLLWWSRSVPRLHEPGVSDGQPEVAPNVVLMGLYWKPLAWLHELKSA